jgi:hypothetical protein
MTTEANSQNMTIVTSRTKAILKEEGAESAFKALRENVQEAERVIAGILHEDESITWSFEELYEAALERNPELTDTAIGIALGGLEKAGVMHLDASLRIHVS